MSLRRSLVLGTVGLTAVLAAPTVALADSAPAHPQTAQQAAPQKHAPGQIRQDSLRALGSRTGLRTGTAVDTDLLGSDQEYTDLVNTQFNVVTPENVMKWEVVEPEQGQYDWSGADELVKSAQRNGQLVRGHNLVWHSQLPTWLSPDGVTSPFSSDQLKQILKKHIMDEAGRYKGRIWQWDVVNEAFNDDGTPRQDIWYKAWGNSTDYIADAFRWAKQADPGAELFYNDYNIEYSGPKVDAVYGLVTKLKAQGVPIDGVGFQTHLSTAYGFPNLQEQLQRFADLGLNVAETEVDVRTSVLAGTKNTPATGQLQSVQEAYWDQTLKACLFVQRCVSYTAWGVGDANSWVPGTFAGEGAALLYDEQLQPKRQYTVVQQDLALAGGLAPHRIGRGSGGR